MEHVLKADALLTMCAAISVGTLLIIISRKLSISAIVLLLLGGIALGPQALGIVNPVSLGSGLSVIVSLAVSMILFEGGLTLDINGYRAGSTMIKRLLSVGVAVTWLGTAVAIWALLDTEPSMALLTASLVIVTGPTVIAPLLRRIRVRPSVHNILHWEGVLIDPIGVFVALLCFEWTVDDTRGAALVNFLYRGVSGVALGWVGGFLLYQIMRRRWVPDDMLNLLALAGAILIFGVTESLISEAGLLAVVVAGFVLGLNAPPALKEIRRFKAEITDLMIGMLFIILAARLDFTQFADFGWRGAIVVGVVILLVRPLNILASSWRLGLEWREKLFLSWVAPRGIVAASMASMFSLRLKSSGAENPWLPETFTYSVIIATVLLQGFSAGPLARLLGLTRVEPTGWLIVGAHPFARGLAKFMTSVAKHHVVLVDLNPVSVRESRAAGLTALHADARDTALQQHIALAGVGNLLALTDNEDLNQLVCDLWAETLGKEHVFRWTQRPSEATREVDGAEHVIWRGLPKPSHVSQGLDLGKAAFIEQRGVSQEQPSGISLLVFEEVTGRLSVLPSGQEPQEARATILRLEGNAVIGGGTLTDIPSETKTPLVDLRFEVT